MNRIVMKSRVGHDGTLSLSLPLGAAEADREVQVTVEPCTSATPPSQSDWAAWVDSMAGSWEGDFERPSQGAFEVREPLS